MKPEKLIEVLSVAERLKDAVRHSYTSGGRRESVAEHSWRITLMAYFVSDEFPEADLLKIMKMCLIHDLGEAFTGDIPAFEKTDKDSEKEADVLGEWVKILPEPFDKEMAGLYQEMEEQQTLEARIYKALDKLEALIQHNESDIKLSFSSTTFKSVKTAIALPFSQDSNSSIFFIDSSILLFNQISS